MSSERKFYGMHADHVTEQSQKGVIKNLERLNVLTQFTKESFANLRIASDKVRSGEYLVFFANHTHHANIGVFDSVIWGLEPRPANTYIAVSRTLSDNGQDAGLVSFSQNYEAVRSSQGIHQVPFLVERDMEKMKKKVKEGEMERAHLQKLFHETYENREALFATLEEDAMFMVFPETTTEGGVFDLKNNTRIGMLQVKSPILAQLYDRAHKSGRRISFVPISINGFSDVLEPRTQDVKRGAKVRIGMKEYLKVDPGWFGVRRPIRASVGEPLDDDFFTKKGLVEINGGRLQVIDRQEFTDALCYEIAKGLDSELQGYYQVTS